MTLLVRPLPTFSMTANEVSGLTAKTENLEKHKFRNFFDYFERSDITLLPSKGRFSKTPIAEGFSGCQFPNLLPKKQ